MGTLGFFSEFSMRHNLPRCGMFREFATWKLFTSSARFRSSSPYRFPRSQRNYFIFSYAAAKSASGSGTVSVSLLKFWNEIFSCLPVFIAASRSGAIAVPA